METAVEEGQWQEVKSKNSGLPNGYEEKEPDFSDPEDYEDDVSDYELLPDILERQPKGADGIDAVIIVDNVPVVGPERVNKLKTVIKKIFSKFGSIHSENYPEKDGKTSGFIFIEYESAQDAKDAVKRGDLYKLDKSHTLRVNHFSDFEKYEHASRDSKKPEKQPFKDVGNLQFYLEEENCNDQFSVIYEGGQKTAIMLNTSSEASVVEERPRWTETYTRWSPKGLYLATFHTKGIALWGGEKFKQIQRFAHQGVQLIDFSPCERYLVTFSPMAQSGGDDQQAIIVWEIFTGLKKRTFLADMSGEDDRQWPIFKWSHDGKYFARKAKGVLSVYETPSMGLLEKKSIAVDDINEFSWSPADNFIAFWVSERKNIPARVTVLSIPSRKELRVKNLFNISDIRLNWHKLGRFLCVKVDRYSKSKKATYSNFEIFHLHEKQVPVDIVELKEQVIAFAWEPTGNKFCCLHGEAPRVSATFYEIKAGKVEHLATMDRKQATHIFWSPAGQFLLLVGLNSATSQLEFIDAGDFTTMNTGEHLMVSDVEWDPTGRYLFSVVSWWAHKIDNAYWVWSFQGRLLRKCPMEQLCQLLWRPRPPTALTDQTVQEIRKELKTYSEIFEAKDRLLQNRVSKDIIDKRRKQMKLYNDYREHCRETYLETKPYRRELRSGVNTDELDSHIEDWDEVTVEILIDEEDIILTDQE